MRYFKYLGRLFAELIGYADENKAWWIVPLVAVLLVLGVLVFVFQGAIMTAVYTLF